MLRSAEITVGVVDLSGATVDGEPVPFHNLYWAQKLSLSLDCFICQRIDRTMTAEWGPENGTCTGDSEFPSHPAALRLSSFNISRPGNNLALSAIADYWSAPFIDRKRGRASQILSRAPFVRVHLGYVCLDRPSDQRGPDEGNLFVQTNQGLPSPLQCRHCRRTIGVAEEPPAIRVLT